MALTDSLSPGRQRPLCRRPARDRRLPAADLRLRRHPRVPGHARGLRPRRDRLQIRRSRAHRRLSRSATSARRYYDPAFGNAPNFETEGAEPPRRAARRVDRRRPASARFRRRQRMDALLHQLRHAPPSPAVERPRAARLLWRPADVSPPALRIDDHSRFGGEWTFGANASSRVVGEWRLRASYGEGFKAPTLYPAALRLRQRRARARDAAAATTPGIEYGDATAALHLRADRVPPRQPRPDRLRLLLLGARSALRRRPFGYLRQRRPRPRRGLRARVGAQVSPAICARGPPTAT